MKLLLKMTMGNKTVEQKLDAPPGFAGMPKAAQDSFIAAALAAIKEGVTLEKVDD